MKQDIQQFGGLITEVDDAVNPGAVDILNWDITLDKTLRKSKGYELNNTIVPCTKISYQEVASTTNVIYKFHTSVSTIGSSYIFTPEFINLSDEIQSSVSNKLLKLGAYSTDHYEITLDTGVSYTLESETKTSLRQIVTGFNLISWTDTESETALDMVDKLNVILGAGAVTNVYKWDGSAFLDSAIDSFNIERGDGYYINSTVIGGFNFTSEGIIKKKYELKTGDNYIGLQFGYPYTAKQILDEINAGGVIATRVSIFDEYYGTGWIQYNSNGTGTNFSLDNEFQLSGIKIDMTADYDWYPENLWYKRVEQDYNLVKISDSMTGFTTGMDIMDITHNGSYYDKTSDRIYAFWGNDTSSYLMYTDKDLANWNFFEGASAGACTAFNITKNAEFIKYNNEIIFVKGESKVIASATGGTFVLNTASSKIELYGIENNPTGETIEVFGERIYVGNISKQEDVAQNGASWVQVSKIQPEKTDTTSTIASSGSVVGENTILNFGATHSFNRGEFVFVSDITSTAGTEVLNGKFWKITEVDTNTITIDGDTTGKVAPADGVVIKRGNTWTPSYISFDGLGQGGGIFRCDDNIDDAIVALRRNLGSLFILRQNNPYVLSGDFSNGSLAKQLNIPYKTLSKSTALTANGFYFISNFGLSMVNGQLIKDNPNQFDNIGSQLPTELIKKRFNDIVDKSKCILNFNNRFVWLHDPEYIYTYSFDTQLLEWTVYSGKLASQFFTIGDNILSVDKMIIYKHQQGYNSFDLNTLTYNPLASTYRTAIFDQNSLNLKQYQLLYTLLQGVNSSDSEVILQVDVYYNSESTPRVSLQYDTKTGNEDTWIQFTTATETWEDVAGATTTWNDLVGSPITAIERGTPRLGSSKQIQFAFNHNSANDGKVSKISLMYDIIDIGTFKSTTGGT